MSSAVFNHDLDNMLYSRKYHFFKGICSCSFRGIYEENERFEEKGTHKTIVKAGVQIAIISSVL